MCAGEEHRYSSHYNKKRKHEEDKKQGGNNENRVEAHTCLILVKKPWAVLLCVHPVVFLGTAGVELHYVLV